MDLKQLEYFVRVAEMGSFTRASIVLDIAQPALSRQIRLLEVELRQNMLARNGRGVTLTEAGRVLLEHSRGILHQVARTREELDRVRGAITGRVAVGLPPSMAKALTVPLTHAFRKQMPDASLCIREALSVTMQESLISGGLDIALLYNATPSPDMETQPLLEEDLWLIRKSSGKRMKSVSLSDVAAEPLIVPSRPNAFRMLIETELANAGLHANIALEIDGVAAILDLVAEGAGAAILPKQAITSFDQPSKLAACPIHPPLRSRLFLAVSARRPATSTQRSMITLIRDLVSGRSQIA
jgi:LysR family nitrogen assimilation transcriptional regulator